MTVPRSETRNRRDDSTAARADAVPWSGAEQVRIGWEAAETHREFAVLFRGHLRADPLPATVDVDEVAEASGDVCRLSGTVAEASAAVVVDGELLAATFEDPAPTLWIGDEAVEPDAWPTVEEYAPTAPGVGSASTMRAAELPSDPVPEPFPHRGMLGKPLGDPLDPNEYVVELVADDRSDDGSGTLDASSFVLEVEGEVVDVASEAASAADADFAAAAVTREPVAGADDATGEGDPDERVAGELAPGAAATVEVRGSVSWIETDDGIDLGVRERDS